MKDAEYVHMINTNILGDVYYYSNKVGNVDIYTIGCELSQWDGERILETITANSNERCIIFNTCAVTLRAQKASEILIKMLDQMYPDIKKYIVGCGVNYNYDYYKKYGICLTNESKFDPKSYNKNYTSRFNRNFDHNHVDDNCGLVKIQDGCNNHCTYCVINKLRNKPYSLPYSDIHRQISDYISNGKCFIWLLGTEICKYDSDGMKVSDLCKKILEDFPNIENLTFGALDPASKEVEKLIDLIQNNPDKMNNIITLSAQSACDEILRLMKRRHNVKRLEYIVNYGKERNVYFAYHIIPGFPGETEELFNITYENLKKFKPVHIHCMGFSARKGTPAYDMIQNNSPEVIEKRKRLLFSISEDINNIECKCNNVKKTFKESRDSLYEQYLRRVINLSNTKRITIDEINENIEDNVCCYINVYNPLEIKKAVSNLIPCKSHHNITFVFDYDDNFDSDTLEVYTKYITVTYEIKCMAKIKLTDVFMDKFLNNKFDIIEFTVQNNIHTWLVADDNDFDSKKFVLCYLKLSKFVSSTDKAKIIESIKDLTKRNRIRSMIEMVSKNV